MNKKKNLYSRMWGNTWRGFLRFFSQEYNLMCTDINENDDWDQSNPLDYYARSKYAR